MIEHVLLMQEQTKRKAMRVKRQFWCFFLFCHGFTVLVATGFIMMKYGENGFCHFDTSVF